jgi:hypothetical protein
MVGNLEQLATIVVLLLDEVAVLFFDLEVQKRRPTATATGLDSPWEYTDGHNVLGTWKDQDEATKHNTPKHTRDSTGYPKAWTSEVSECSSLTHKIDMLTCSNTTCLYGDIIKKCKIL